MFAGVALNVQIGFLVLNSWGERWGGDVLPTAGGNPEAAAGIALWDYRDWARSIRDGWVLRLGVPGRAVFTAGAGDPAPRVGPDGRRVQSSIPARELRGHFLNIEDGRCAETGAYATPRRGLAAHLDNLERDIVGGECAGGVFYENSAGEIVERKLHDATRPPRGARAALRMAAEPPGGRPRRAADCLTRAVWLSPNDPQID